MQPESSFCSSLEEETLPLRLWDFTPFPPLIQALHRAGKPAGGSPISKSHQTRANPNQVASICQVWKQDGMQTVPHRLAGSFHQARLCGALRAVAGNRRHLAHGGAAVGLE